MYQPPDEFSLKSPKPYLLLCLALLLSLPLAAQRDLSFKELYQEIANAKGTYLLRNATVRFNPASDQFALKPNLDSNLVKVEGEIQLRNVHFVGPELGRSDWFIKDTYLSAFDFQKQVSMIGCSGALPRIVNAQAESFWISSSTINTLHLESIKAGWIMLENNKVEAQIQIRKCDFGEMDWVAITNNKSISLLVDSSTIRSYMEFVGNSIVLGSDRTEALDYGYAKGQIQLSNTSFQGEFRNSLNAADGFTISRCVFQSRTLLEKLRLDNYLTIEANRFSAPCYIREINSVQGRIMSNRFSADSLREDQLQLSNIDLRGLLDISLNELQNSEAKFGMALYRVNSQYLAIYNNVLHVPLKLVACNTRSRFALTDNDFKAPVVFSAMAYGIQSYIIWDQLKEVLSGIRIQNKGLFASPADSIVYLGRDPRFLREEDPFKRLLQVYSELRNLYRAQGNLSDANEVEVLLGDLRLRRYRLDYEDDPSLQTYFNWKVNNFMRVFTAYGTNPILAILYSLRIIFIFAFFYMLFHNQWDFKTQGKLASRLRLILNYFRSKEDLSVHYDKEFGKDRKDQKELEQAYHRSANKVPPFFLRLTELYFKYLNLKPNLKRSFLERTEMLSGTWLSLPAGRKYWVAFALSTWFSVYLLWFVLAKFLNALALSVNAFTTLGFGYIPTEGISRYVLILEGLLGWLMMSIFSVTLISQIIG